MTPQELEHLAELKGRCTRPEFLERLYGISWPPSPEFAEDFAGWEQSRNRKGCGGGLVSRWELEAFFRSRRLLPTLWAAASLGMTPESLRRLLPELPRLGMRRCYQVYPNLIDESLSDDLVEALPGLRYRTFGTHDSFCELLQRTLKDSLGVEFRAWHCGTSLEMGEYPVLYARHVDCITLQPVSVRHTHWLDLGKPVSLPPDRCSKLFYLRNLSELSQSAVGSGEPEGLDQYLSFVAGQVHRAGA